ncbi:hypothetical protein EF888_11710 [Silicimonas algicola]|uniref:Uncharacterized protein n=1 Tax=Silicimonas algicola TaxID=1826607 RepID=A0A316GA65_9RHOB|nr:hypothetical protein [Silicimonas algicola]AZQ67742.1 hypothetical protein EF888_11710 [Silicimonas algicola]PWK57849.1 hypothetical protein C8D95_102498 [Silicimonas algicola]
MATSKIQRTGFEDRLSRIKKGGDNTMGEVHIGPRDEVRAGQKRKPGTTVRLKKKKQSKKEIGRASGVSLLILAFLFGALSMFVGQAASYHLFAETGLIQLDLSATPAAPYVPVAHIVIGGFFAVLFAWTFQLMGVVRLAAIAAGLFVMVQYQPVLIKSVPGVYAAFFSDEFVESQLGKA